MGNYVNPNHPVGPLLPQESGFMNGVLNDKKTGSRHGSLAQRSYQSWVADAQAQAKTQTAPVSKRSAA